MLAGQFPSDHPKAPEDCFADFSEAVQSRLSWAPAGTMDHLKAADASCEFGTRTGRTRILKD